MATSKLTLCHLQDDLSLSMSGIEALVRLPRPVERKDAVDDGAHLPTVEEWRHLLKPPAFTRQEDPVQGDISRIDRRKVPLWGQDAGHAAKGPHPRENPGHAIIALDVEGSIHATTAGLVQR